MFISLVTNICSQPPLRASLRTPFARTHVGEHHSPKAIPSTPYTIALKKRAGRERERERDREKEGERSPPPSCSRIAATRSRVFIKVFVEVFVKVGVTCI